MFKTELLQYVGIFQFNSCMLSETESVCVFFFCSFIWSVIRLRLFDIITTMHIPIIWHAFHFNPHVESTRIRLIVFEYVCLGTCGVCVCAWVCICLIVTMHTKEGDLLSSGECVRGTRFWIQAHVTYVTFRIVVPSKYLHLCMRMLFFWKRHSEKHE